MAGATNAEAAATLDLRFPTTGATDYVAYSVNGSSEYAGLVRTAVGATNWGAATVADPSVKQNVADLIATDVPDLLKKLNGRKVALNGNQVILKTDGL